MRIPRRPKILLSSCRNKPTFANPRSSKGRPNVTSDSILPQSRAMWTPPAGQEEYYSTPCPSDLQWSVPQLLVPLLGQPSDSTYGRSKLPRSPDELAIRKEHKTTDGLVSLDGGKGKEFISYQVWEPKEGVKQKGASLVCIHGINDYGGKFSCHVKIFLDAGYRVIAPDLPSHGRSSGIHCYLPDLDRLAVYLVLQDVVKNDSASGQTLEQRHKLYISGQSLGGFVAVLTCLKYGAPNDTDLPVEADFRPVISGGLFLCPMLAISPETRPHYSIELVARGISAFAGSLPLAAANKGKNSEDPTVEEQFNKDPQTYHGKLRVGTGLAILKGLTEVDALMGNLRVPFSLHHGTGDRVTSYHGSEKLYKEASSTDKKLHLYDGYEHILLRVGQNEQDDQRRQNVLRDMLAWLEAH
ncbi:lysophospholipase [Meredithblackwellia eburnea MCA 4105]